MSGPNPADAFPKPATDATFTHPDFGPICLADGYPKCGPIFLSREGYRAWNRAGRPKIRAVKP